MCFPGSGVTDQTQGFTFFDPLAAGQGVDRGGVDGGGGVEVEVSEPLLPGEPGGFDPPNGAAPVTVVAFRQQQLGQEPSVGQLLTFGGVRDLGVAGPQG